MQDFWSYSEEKLERTGTTHLREATKRKANTGVYMATAFYLYLTCIPGTVKKQP